MPSGRRLPVGLRYVHPLDRPGLSRLRPVLHPVGQLGLLRGSQRDLAVDAGRLAASVDLRDPPHADQRVGAGAEHQLLQIADLVQVPCLCRREDPLPQTPYVILGLLPVDRQPVGDSSSGPFTTARPAACAVACPTCPSVPGSISIASSQAHLATSAPFRVRAHARIRPVIRGTAGGGAAHHVPRFPLPFGHRHSLLGHPVPAGEIGLPHGRPTGTCQARTPTGFPRSAQLRCDRGGCPLYPGDGGVLPAGGSLTGRHPPLPSGQSLHPAGTSTWRGSNVTRHHQGFTRVHPSGLPLACGPRTERETLGRLLRASHPAVTSDARRSGDRPLDTGPGSHLRHQPTSSQ